MLLQTVEFIPWFSPSPPPHAPAGVVSIGSGPKIKLNGDRSRCGTGTK